MNDPQPPLDYRPKHSPNGELAWRVLAMFVGCICGVVLVIIGGIFVASMADSDHPLEMSFRYWPGVYCFFGIAIAGFLGCVCCLMQRHRHMFFAGLMLGAALMSLLEGSCFYSYEKI